MNLTLARSRIDRILQQGIKLGWRPSDMALLFEYTRRLILLEQEVRVLEQDEKILVALLFDPSDASSNPEQLRYDCKEVLEVLSRGLTHGCGHAMKILENYVYWIALIEQGNSLAVAHSDLFEPLIRMLERGACFIYRKGWADFAIGGTPMDPGWHKRKFVPLGELDDASLDEYDRLIQIEEERLKIEKSKHP